MNFKELFEGAQPKLPGAVGGIQIMTPQQFVAKSNEKEEVDEGWREEAEDMGEWAEYVRKKLLSTPKEQRWAVGKRLSQIEMKNFGSELVPFKKYDSKTGQLIADPQMHFTQIVQDTWRAIGMPLVTSGGPGSSSSVSTNIEPDEIRKPDDRGGRDWVFWQMPHGWIKIPEAGRAPDRVKRLLHTAFFWGPEIFPLALEVFQEKGDFTEQDLRDVRNRAIEIRQGTRLEESVKRKLNEFDTQTQLAPPELQKDEPVKVVFYGRMPQDYRAEDVWEALPEVLPNEYPYTTAQKPGLTQQITLKIMKDGGAVVTVKPKSVAQKLVKTFQTYGIKARIIEGPVNEATKLPAQARELKGQELEDYLDRIRTQSKSKTDKYKLPYIHRSSVMGYYNEEGKKYDTDAIKNALKERPKKLLKQNEKMKHSNGELEQFYNIGFAALTGIALDENTNELIIVNTCPGAGSCKVDCFAMKGGKIQFQGPWLSDGRILTYLLNDPEGFFSQLKSEIDKEEKKGQKGGYKVSIRWHDAGDFFSPEYVDLAFKLARSLPNVDFYAYTKIADVALGQKPNNFIINWSEGASTSQEKKVKSADPNLETTKNSRIVPSNLFYDLLVKDAKKNLVKGPGGQWQVIPDKLPELKQRLADEYGISANSILSYDEWEQKTDGGKKQTPVKYNVIITPGEPDITAKSHGVLSTLLLKH